jgi:hypothetical protein
MENTASLVNATTYMGFSEARRVTDLPNLSWCRITPYSAIILQHLSISWADTTALLFTLLKS